MGKPSADFNAIYDYSFTGSKQLPGPSPSPQQCKKAVRRACLCQLDDQSEPAWNSSVHDFILDLAIDNDEFSQRLYFLNCSTARIAPSSLIPKGHAGIALNSKSVDFVIYVKPSATLQNAMKKRAERAEKLFSVNHTLYHPLLHRPIGVIIETTIPGHNLKEALAQVGIWAAAHFTKLEQLIQEADDVCKKSKTVRNRPELPMQFIPIIIVLGHEWYFMAAIREANKQTTLYGRTALGSTDTPLGVYQVVATIQLLARWVRDSYTKWFMKACFNLEDTVSDTAPTNSAE